MNSIELAGFDYSTVPATDRPFLKDKVGVIRHLTRTCAEGVLHIGRHLIEARDRIGAGPFAAWVETEFAWTARHAARFMDAAAAFGTSGQIVGRFDASALYVLSAPSAPTQARDFAIDMARDGEYVSHQIAKRIVDGLKADPELSAIDVKRYFKNRPKEEEVSVLSQDVFDDHKLLWAAVRKLILNNYSVHFTWEPHNIDDTCDAVPEDPETGLRNALFKVTVYNYRDTKPKIFTSPTTLEALLLDATDSHPMQRCTGECKKLLRLYEDFSAKKGNRFRRSRACKKCEVKRVGKYKKAERQAKAATPPS